MPNKSIPTIGESNWGVTLNRHLSQSINPTTGSINSFSQFSQRPTTLTLDDIDLTYLYTQTGNLHRWSGDRWNILNQSFGPKESNGRIKQLINPLPIKVSKQYFRVLCKLN